MDGSNAVIFNSHVCANVAPSKSVRDADAVAQPLGDVPCFELSENPTSISFVFNSSRVNGDPCRYLR